MVVRRRSAAPLAARWTQWGVHAARDRDQFRAQFEPPTGPPELDKFVYRTVPFAFEGGKAVAVDGRRRFDFLGGFLLQRANGTRRLRELLDELATTPNNEIRGSVKPTSLSDALRTLRNNGFVALDDEPRELPPELALPMSEQLR